MAAVGMDLPRDTFSRLLQGGHHLLAPTASDLARYDVSTIFAGFHYGINDVNIILRFEFLNYTWQKSFSWTFYLA